LSNSEAVLAVAGVPDFKCYIWSWKSGHRLACIDLDKSSLSLLPVSVSFSPVNWRHVMMAYEAPVSDVHIWSIEYFDHETRSKCSMSTRFRLPLTDRAIQNPEPVCMGSDLNKEEWDEILPAKNAYRHITGLPNANITKRKDADDEQDDKVDWAHVELDDLDDDFKSGDKYSRLVEALALDRRERHEFRSACWSSNGEQLLIATKSNYVFRVS
jgi:hypothetical protein